FLVPFGVPVPEVWQLTRGKVAPVCREEPFRIAALLGGPPDDPASSISQVVPASPGCLYEFSFWGIGSADGAAGEILWRVNDCSSPRRDPVAIQAAVPPAEGDVDLTSTPLTFHRLRVTPPDGATAAEVRFRTTSGVAAVVDRASFRTVSP